MVLMFSLNYMTNQHLKKNELLSSNTAMIKVIEYY